MEIRIEAVKTRKQLQEFIQFPMRLYRDNPYFVPPLIKEEISTLSPTINPVFTHADAYYFLAYKGNEIVGRIAALINWQEVEQGKSLLRFGWYDVIEDEKVSKALFEKIEEIAREKKLEKIEGPMGFSNLDKAGLLTFGFDKIATMATLYNAAYYEAHLLDLGFEPEKEWVEFEIEMPEILPERIEKFSKIIRQRYHLQVLDFQHTKDFLPYAEQMFALINKTYAHLSTFVPITDAQIQHYKTKYLPLVRPEFVNAIADENGKMIAFAITMPSYSQALQKAKGRLFPFGWIHFLRVLKNNHSAAFYLIGVDPEFQNKGVTAIIFEQMFQVFKKYEIHNLETNPELIENKSIQALWSPYNPVNHKRRKTFSKTVSEF